MDEPMMFTASWLHEVLERVDLNTNEYSIVTKMLDAAQRGKIIAVLLPKLNEHVAAHLAANRHTNETR